MFKKQDEIKQNPLSFFLHLISISLLIFSPFTYCTSWLADKYSGPSVKMIIIILIFPHSLAVLMGVEWGRS